MKDDEELKETMKLKMPGPQVHKELPKYKSFNRYSYIFFSKSQLQAKKKTLLFI